ncbi:hypothetical protein [Candidiatus Paracoxiella cheracis]|uniref:hypothetical protein n=1 Tax=Candidiatus Paracoxiella cheracis TaxID=3405120 RepID=UPI003BF4BE8F
MTARKDFLQSLTLGKKSEPTAEYAPSLRSPWRASIAAFLYIQCNIFFCFGLNSIASAINVPASS